MLCGSLVNGSNGDRLQAASRETWGKTDESSIERETNV